MAKKNLENRFARQIIIPEIKTEGQKKLEKAHILILGAGGLGTPAALYLAAAGIGQLTLVDFDTIEQTNLNRQFLYTFKDIGKNKAKTLAKKINAIYPDCEILAKKVKISKKNIEKIIEKPDIILLCVDNQETRLLVNNYALKHNIPLIDGGVDGFYGYLFFVDPSDSKAPCLASMHKFSAPKSKEKTNIAALGVTCGIIASMQASLALNIILDMPNPYKHCILQYDGKLGEFEKIPLMQDSRA